MVLFEPLLYGLYGGSLAIPLNTPTWTIKWELLCYLLIMGIGIWNPNLRGGVAVFTVLLVFIAVFCSNFSQDGKTIQGLVAYINSLLLSFFFGTVLFLYFNKKVLVNHLYAFICTVVLLVVFMGEFLIMYLYVALIAFLVIYLAFATKKINASKYGDLSYGIYIYAWPIQQIVAKTFEFKEGYFFYYVGASFVITAFFAFLSWHLVEKVFIKIGK